MYQAVNSGAKAPSCFEGASQVPGQYRGAFVPICEQRCQGTCSFDGATNVPCQYRGAKTSSCF